MFCKKLFCDITIRLVTINFQSCIPYSVTPCIMFCLINFSFYFVINYKLILPVVTYGCSKATRGPKMDGQPCLKLN
jgi:hypothetical protein